MAETNIEELRLYMERLEDRIKTLEKPVSPIIEENKPFEDIKTYPHLKADNFKITRASFVTENNVGNSSTAATIDWSIGNKQSITTTGNCTLTFKTPFGPCNLILKIIHEASATAYTYTYPATVKWASGTKPSTTNTSGAVDIISFYFDGTNYYGAAVLNLS